MLKLLFVLTLLVFTSAHGRSDSGYILPYETLMKLKTVERNNYLKKIGKALILLEGRQDVKTSSFWDVLISKSFADEFEDENGIEFRCIGGGVPVPKESSNCGVSEYAGFKCEGSDQGKEICNPLVFGLRSNGKPVCYPNATTRKCYRNTVTGRTTFFTDAAFKTLKVRNAYKNFKTTIDAICTGGAKVEESNRYRNEACSLLNKQTEINRTRADDGRLELSHIRDTSRSVTGYESLSGDNEESSEMGTGRARAENLPDNAGGIHSPRAARAFTERCVRQGIRRQLCDEMTRPNMAYIGTFRRVYPGQPHILMPPAEDWDGGIQILKIAAEVEAANPNIQICEVRNWYRPEPYNRTVQGVATSNHIRANAIDIQYCSRSARNAAIRAFEIRRANGESNLGIGRYKSEGSHVIHLNLRSETYIK